MNRLIVYVALASWICEAGCTAPAENAFDTEAVVSDQDAVARQADAAPRDGSAGDVGPDVGERFAADALGPDIRIGDTGVADAQIGSDLEEVPLVDSGSTATPDADLCPAIASRPAPMLIDRFEDGSPEVEEVAEGYRVIVPEGHRALAQHALAALPSCHQAIADEMGYCHPWGEAIVHYGRFEPSRAKAEHGVVYIGRSEASLSRLGDPAVWRAAPAVCGGQTTFAHESVHTFQPAGLPAWVKEGWADYFGKILVGGSTYECGAVSVCVRPPNSGGRPQPELCPNPIEYWDVSDPDWGVRPDPKADRGDEGTSNKDRYYKTGTCFWQTLRDTYGPDALRDIFVQMHLAPRDDLPIFPFSAETNDRFMRTYVVPVTGPGVWPLVEQYGVVQVP